MEGSAVLIAGASGGIGRAIVMELLWAGAEVILLGRNMLRLHAVVPLHNLPDVDFVVADLSDSAAIDQVAVSLGKRDRLDALVLSSGIYERSSDAEAFRRQFNANVIGPYALVRGLLPMLLKSRGQIVFVNSSQGLKAAGGAGQYAATMHAARAVADSLREEVGGRGVRVTSLFLGRTAGERQEQIFALEGRPYSPDKLIQPADVARTIRFVLQLPRTAEVKELVMRPAQKLL